MPEKKIVATTANKHDDVVLSEMTVKEMRRVELQVQDQLQLSGPEVHRLETCWAEAVDFHWWWSTSKNRKCQAIELTMTIRLSIFYHLQVIIRRVTVNATKTYAK